mmetsp:Transcript_32138/g.59183  ORF Transcript_32138/g.59183 Transcript_32138/m.59183 type:complete len:207 (-) Transcript_32138:445-1065(-)
MMPWTALMKICAASRWRPMHFQSHCWRLPSTTSRKAFVWQPLLNPCRLQQTRWPRLSWTTWKMICAAAHQWHRHRPELPSSWASLLEASEALGEAQKSRTACTHRVQACRRSWAGFFLAFAACLRTSHLAWSVGWSALPACLGRASWHRFHPPALGWAPLEKRLQMMGVADLQRPVPQQQSSLLSEAACLYQEPQSDWTRLESRTR